MKTLRLIFDISAAFQAFCLKEADRAGRAQALFKCHSLHTTQYLNTVTGCAYHVRWTKALAATQ